MKPKGGAKCSRRTHSLRLKCLESRKRVRLGRKSFWSQGDLEALIFTESGQVYRQEDGSGRQKPGKTTAPVGGGVGGRGRKQASKLGCLSYFHAFRPLPPPMAQQTPPPRVGGPGNG